MPFSLTATIVRFVDIFSLRKIGIYPINTYLYPMKRRQFLQSIGATVVAAGLPIPTPVVAKTAVRPVAFGMSPYAWAKYTARVNRKLSPHMLRNFLGLSEGDAAEMLARLTRENIISAPNDAGVYQATTDYLEHYARKRAKVKTMLRTLTEENEKRLQSIKPNVPDLNTEITGCGCEADQPEAAAEESEQDKATQ